MELDATYWDRRYQQNDRPWDIGCISPPLKYYFDQLENKQMKILIPGAGLAHEAVYLSDSGFTDITVCDFSREVIGYLQESLQGRDNIHLLCSDFFALNGQYDLIIEQTFFCALDPILREPYVQKMYGLLKPGGKLTGLLFDKKFDAAGPPFGGEKTEYLNLFNRLFHIKLMDMCYCSIKPRDAYELFFICEKRII